MKTAAALSLLLASASAFAPPSTHMRSAPSTAMFADEEPAVEAEPAAEPAAVDRLVTASAQSQQQWKL